MAEKSFLKTLLKKLVIGIIVGIILVVVAKSTHFPHIFQIMFFFFFFLGALVFILLDAPAMKRLEGGKAVVALIVFYLLLSGLYIAGASILPQFDPEDEKGKIEKILRAKKAATEQGKADELLARAKELDERAKAITQQLSSLGAGAQVEVEVQASSGGGGAASGDLIALGKEQWDLQECYNCHKLFGQGGKKRGPELDNLGNLMTPDQIKEKVLYPKKWMAEGFDKEFEKGKMPDKYRELMEESEVDALVAFLSSLKDASVKTPTPIKKY